MKLPTTINIPWKPNDVTMFGKNNYVLNAKQVEYFKALVKALMAMYSDIANAFNKTEEDVIVLQDKEIVCYDNEVICYENEVVYE